ncbi:hypothetical protein, partial [Leptospira interrogans]|uniref:hypothetical protein n=1 Tax=Leptospira interrogans TaxID=173 RepID=UPI000A44A5E7
MEIPKELKHYVAAVRSNIELKKFNETLFTKAFELSKTLSTDRVLGREPLRRPMRSRCIEFLFAKISLRRTHVNQDRIFMLVGTPAD